MARDIEQSEHMETVIVSCRFTYGSKDFYIEVQQYYGKERIPRQTFEKDATDVETYYSNGREFYIMLNLSDSRAVHTKSQTVVTISGDLSSETLKQIIDSIGA